VAAVSFVVLLAACATGSGRPEGDDEPVDSSDSGEDAGGPGPTVLAAFATYPVGNFVRVYVDAEGDGASDLTVGQKVHIVDGTHSYDSLWSHLVLSQEIVATLASEQADIAEHPLVQVDVALIPDVSGDGRAELFRDCFVEAAAERGVCVADGAA
jgi:hypothetical protein